MSIVKYIAKSSKSLSRAIQYALKNREDGALSHFEGLPADGKAAYLTMASIQKIHNYKGTQKYRSIIHSFSDEEMKVLSKKEMLEMSVKLAKRAFPGYQFVVGMHTDTKNIHNHIVFNISHPDRKRNIIQNKLEIRRLMRINHSLMRERGIKVPKYAYELSKEKRDYSKDRRVKIGNIPYVRDLKQKMDYARSLATDFHEYSAYLDTFNVGIRVEKKNISYLYPSKQKPIRAKHLGKEYEKSNLAEQFYNNYQKYKESPILKEVTEKRFKGTFGIEKAYQRRIQELESFVSKNRREERYMSPSTKDLLLLGISRDDINRASRKSLLGYIKANKIKTHENPKGELVLTKREHIVIRDSIWINTKNKTHGNLIDFVAIHQNLSYLDAISRISDNKRLSLLSKEYGIKKPVYKSFYIPKDKRMGARESARELNDLFFKLNINRSYADDLLRRNQAQVSKSGVIHLFGMGDSRGSFLFEKDEDGKWNKKKVGKLDQPFFKSSQNSKEGVIFLDPFSFMKSSQVGLRAFERRSSSILVLMGKDNGEVDKFVAENSKLSKLTFYFPKERAPDPMSFALMKNLQKRYRQFGIEISITDDLGKSLSRSRGFER